MGLMSTVNLKGEPVQTSGELPLVGAQAPDYDLATTGDRRITRETFGDKRVVLNIFPNIETGTCQMSVRAFNEKASSFTDTVVLCVSNDELATLQGFCAAEGLDNVVVASAKGTSFDQDYGLAISEGPLAGRTARAVVVLDADGSVLHSELVPEIADEPDYDKALGVL